MLDAWINKDEIIRLLEECDSQNNLIERMPFIRGLNSLKAHKKPKKRQGRTINHISDIINDIRTYQLNVKSGQKKSFIDRWLDEKTINRKKRIEVRGVRWMKEDLGEVPDIITMREFQGDTIITTLKWRSSGDDLYVKMNIIPKEYLTEIVKTTRRTIYRYEKKGIIDRHILDYRKLEYYDLSEMIHKLKTLQLNK